MTTPGSDDGHPTEYELAACVDEPERSALAIRTHLEGCGPCRDRAAALEATRAALALDPPMPSEVAFVAQRERILAMIGAARPSSGRRISRRAAWIVPLAAAAAIAAFVAIDRDSEYPDPALEANATGALEIDERESIRPPLPLLEDARAAADAAGIAIAVPGDPASGVTIVPAQAIDEELLDAVLSASEPLAPPIAVERSLRSESQFAALSVDEQSAVLHELASADFGF